MITPRFESPRRVLILVQNLPVPLDRRVWLEATTLREAGYQVSVISPARGEWTLPYEEREGVHIYRYEDPPEAHSGARAYLSEWGTALRRMLALSHRVKRERGFDVIHGCNPPDLLFLVALRHRASGVRYLFDHHDVCPELFEAKFGRRGALHAAMRSFERMSFAAASVSIATNESFRRIAIERGGMAPEDVFVVRSAPKVDRFVPREVPRPPDDPIRIGYVGVIGQQEGMDLLVAAADHLIRRLGHERVHFDIVGFGPELPAVEADVAARGLAGHFTFHGARFGDDLLAILNRVDIGVAPDPKNPMNDISTMNKVMEYMTLEKPVVQFDLKEGRASAGPAALYARPNAPEDFAARIAELVADPARRREMGGQGRARVLEALSWRHSVPHLLAAYDRVFAKMGQGASPAALAPVGRS